MPDRRISIYDGIRFTTAHKNPKDFCKLLVPEYPEVVTKCHDFHVWMVPEVCFKVKINSELKVF